MRSGGADLARVGEFLADAPVAIAAAMALEDGFDQVADPAVLGLGGRGCGGVVAAAARHLEAGADWPDAMAGGLVDVVDHLAELAGSLVPRMTAAFFLNVILLAQEGVFAAQGAQLVRCGALACGSPCALCRQL